MKIDFSVFGNGENVHLKIQQLRCQWLREMNLGGRHFKVDGMDIFAKLTAIDFWMGPITDTTFDTLKKFVGDEIGGTCQALYTAYMDISPRPATMDAALSFSTLPETSLREEIQRLATTA